jgi:hypothetical protein
MVGAPDDEDAVVVLESVNLVEKVAANPVGDKGV